MYALAYEESLLASAIDIPPLAPALLHERKTTRLSGNSTLWGANVPFFKSITRIFCKIDGLTPVFAFQTGETFERFNALSLRSRLRYAMAINSLNALTLIARTMIPRKARREPMYALAYEESLLASAIDIPPLAPALRHERKTTRPAALLI